MNANLLCSLLSKTVGGFKFKTLISHADGVNLKIDNTIFSPLRTGFRCRFYIRADIIAGLVTVLCRLLKMVEEFNFSYGDK
jgi:hypothetical protein